MTQAIQNKSFEMKMPQLRGIMLFCIGFFLLTSILTAFFIIPKINESIAESYENGLLIDSQLEAELFIRFIESNRELLGDLAQYPSLINAVMLSNGDSPNLIDLLDNVTIRGERGRLVLQDIAGNILLQTSDQMQASYDSDAPWLDEVLNRDRPYHFQLLGQNGGMFTFKMTVPVIYSDNVEGVLSAEISASLHKVFVAQLFDDSIAFKLTQDRVVVKTSIDGIRIPKETSLQLEGLGLSFTYISDEALFRDKSAALRNTILSVLFFGLAISFVLFFIVSYKILSQEVDVAQRGVWGRSYAMPALVALVGVIASITACIIASNAQKALLQQDFIAHSKESLLSIRTRIEQSMEVIESVKGFYDASEFIDREEFRLFTTPLLNRHDDIQALEWVPHVLDKDRSMYEQRARDDGLTDFNFIDKNAAGEFIVAPVQDEYYPVYYVEPLERNKVVLGLAPTYHAERRQAILRARDTGKIVAANPIQLTQNNVSQAGYLMFAPVYNGAQGYLSADLRKKNLRGFVLLVLLADDMVENAMSHAHPINIFIEDISDENNSQPVFGINPDDDRLAYSETIDFAGRSWRVKATPKHVQSDMPWLPMLVLITGLVFSALVTWLLVHQIRRREVVEVMVKERTAELMELQQAMQLAIEGISKIDPKGRYTFVNEAYAGKIGYKPEELIGKPWEMTIVEDQRDAMNDVYQTMLQDGKVVAETIGQHKDGSTLHKQVTMISDYNDEVEFVGHFCFMQDITARKNAELEREALIDSLADSNEELERFAFVCSHDLQEPLRMIRSFSELLQKHMGERLEEDEKGKSYFHFITDGATSAQQLISDILAYSSLDSDTQPLEDVNPESLINVVKEAMRLNLEERKGDITFDKLPILRGNKTQLFQLFQNLISNGLKYQNPDTPPHVHVGLEDNGDHWQFSINDNGIGMEERHLKQIFEVFKRLHGKSHYSGTGIGLSICKKVVTRHGGKIWVESEQGVGSTFYFTILKPTLMDTHHDTKHKMS